MSWRALLTMPGYGDVNICASRSFWRASKDINRVFNLHGESSLLARNFNHLWVAALNASRRGEKFDYFAMLHNDIGVGDMWLDTMIGELEKHNLDILSAVSPIKDGKGLTSTALDDPPHTWRTKCRLTMKEVYRLPETFTAQDVGHPLLINTGCWVCRFDEAWARKVHFTINDRIVFENDRYREETESEDWFFSRRCNELGLRIGATRKIAVNHFGRTWFETSQPWGNWSYDQSHVEESVLPDTDADGFRFPWDVDGWLLYEEGKALSELANGRRVLEIGSYAGKSTICLAQTASRVTCVDTFDGAGTPKPRSTLKEFEHNLNRYGCQAEPIKSQFAPLSAEWALLGKEWDMIFIDGAHDPESVRQDIDSALPLLSEEGLLVFHDYRKFPGEHDRRWDPGVTESVDKLLAAGAELISTHKTLAVVRPKARELMEV